jgi:uncharacterized protein (DUF433 family)
MMQLEDYFDFLSPEDIRIKGHRIGIETVLDGYLHDGMTAEQIQEAYPSLTLEEVYATILYYLQNRNQVTDYMAGWIRYCDEVEAEARRNPHPGTRRLREIRTALEAYPPGERQTMLREVAAEHDTVHPEVTASVTELPGAVSAG